MRKKLPNRLKDPMWPTVFATTSVAMPFCISDQRWESLSCWDRDRTSSSNSQWSVMMAQVRCFFGWNVVVSNMRLARSNGIWNADLIPNLAQNVGTGQDKKLLRIADSVSFRHPVRWDWMNSHRGFKGHGDGNERGQATKARKMKTWTTDITV